MTPEIIKTYLDIQTEVLSIVQKYVELHNSIFVENKLHYPYSYIDEIEETQIYWRGTETWSYGGREDWSHTLPTEILFMTQEQWLKRINEERDNWIEKTLKEKELEDEKIRQQKFKEYQKLKEELGE